MLRAQGLVLRTVKTMGNCISTFTQYIFKGFLTRQINSILKHVIRNKVNERSLYITPCNISSERVTQFEKVIMLVREKAMLHQWEDMMIHLSNTSDFEKSVCMVLNDIIVFPAFQISHLFCFYTMLIDAVVYKLHRRQTVNVDHLLDLVHSHIIEHKGVGILFRIIPM